MQPAARLYLVAFVSSFSAVALVGCSSDSTPGAGAGGAGAGASAGGETAAGAGGASSGSGGAGVAGGAAGVGVAGTGGRAGASAGSTAAGASGGGATGGAAGSSGGAGASGASGGGAGAAAGSGGRDYSTDRSTFFGASRCGAAGVLLCDDFESGTLDAATWKNYQAAPTIDATLGARGSKSLHMKTAATGGSGIQTTKIFPRMGGLYYGRMFIRFSALPTSPEYAHWTIVGSNPMGGSNNGGELRVGGQLEGGKEKFGVGTDHGPTGDWTNLDRDPSANAVRAVPTNEWLCVEWMVDSAKELTKFWWDGVEHPSLATTRDVSHGGNSGVKYDLPDIGSVWVGFENYNQGKTMQPSSYDVWIDEVALDAQRIGCNL